MAHSKHGEKADLLDADTGAFLGVVDDTGREVLLPAWSDATRTSLADPEGVELLFWDDLRFPAQGINPAGASDAPAVDTVLTSFPGTLLFSGSQENVIAGVAQMPHAWRAGTAIKPHIHWSKPVGSAAAVGWELYYRHLGFPSDEAAAWVGPVAGTLSVGAPETTDAHCITGFGSITMTGKRESSMLCWQIRRQGASDADNGTARLLEFDIHYQASKPGTVDEIPT